MPPTRLPSDSELRRNAGRRKGAGLPRRGPSHQLSDRCEVDVVHLPAVRAAWAALPDEAELGRLAEFLGLLSNPSRLKILLALQPGADAALPELCVCDLAAVAGASKSLTSHQLRLLRVMGVVRQRRAGKFAFYRLVEGPFAAILTAVAGASSSIPALARSGTRQRELAP